MLGQLNEIQINNILSSQVIGRIACTNGKQPYIVPVTYTYNGEYIYGQTNEGTKLDILRRNSAVCFEVDTMSDMRNWQSVVVYGDFEELKGEDAEKAHAILFDRVYPLATSSTIHTYGHEERGILDDGTRIKPVMYRIKITKITGRFEKAN
jgi:nitroimidazol reductase NimA-like FMN-containing flavoprotein (pyridoxamine 5'-phosphate oxidase superfamily)